MRRLFVLLCAGLLLCGCDGLPKAREMGDMALLRTMGVDGTEEGLSVTVSTGPRARGLQGEREPALVLSAQRESLSGACLAMQGLSDSYVFFGYVDQLLLGENLARQGVIPVLDYFAQDVELGLGAQLWVVRGATAEEAVRSGGEQGVESRLSTLQTDGEMGVAAISRTAGEVYSDLLERGTAYVPALTPAGGEDTSLLERGYAVFKGNSLAGFLDGEKARGLELLAGRPELDIVETDLGEEQAAVQVIGADTASWLDFEDGQPRELILTCRVEGQLAEYGRAPGEAEREELTRVLEAREKARIQAALETLQGWGADCVGLGAEAAIAAPGKWRAVRDWPELFEDLEVRVEVRATVHI